MVGADLLVVDLRGRGSLGHFRGGSAHWHGVPHIEILGVTGIILGVAALLRVLALTEVAGPAARSPLVEAGRVILPCVARLSGVAVPSLTHPVPRVPSLIEV